MLPFTVSKVIFYEFCLVFITTITPTVTINNGFSVKFSPLLNKEEIKTKAFGALFTKVPQELTPESTQAILTRAIIPQPGDLGKGCTNQIAKLLFPSKLVHTSDNAENLDDPNFINIPILKQNVDEYQILVAIAPKNIRITSGADAKPVVVYIVFFDNNTEEYQGVNMPTVYFVKNNDKMTFDKKEKADPILIIDSNRTVTGLKSTEIAKHVKFRGKFVNRLKREE